MMHKVFAISDRPGVRLEIREFGDKIQLELVVIERHGSTVATRVMELATFHDEKRALIAARWLQDAFQQIDRGKVPNIFKTEEPDPYAHLADAQSAIIENWKAAQQHLLDAMDREILGDGEANEDIHPINPNDIPWDEL